jgi:hypothetical protein
MEAKSSQPAGADRLAALRAERGLRGLTSQEEGFGIDRLPPGIYGFTYSPAEPNCPLFRSHRAQNYEIHKLPNGEGLLLGYVTPEEAKELETSGQPLTLHVFPEPQGGATDLVSIAFDRIVRPKEHSQRGSSGLEIYLRPREEAGQRPS